MDSKQVRKTFLDFFRSKQHEIIPSAPMVVKNDPTLMFTNAGMNQFKDIFLGNSPVKHPRIADTQKCLRVSGKHNDLEEVGHDTYHHTMFEMLGNWSFGDYFKKEAIAWAWELLTGVYQLNKEDLYVTVFGGDEGEQLGVDTDALTYWKEIIPEDRILYGNKKDNFWEMGDSGPCGPCSEIHVDLRSAKEKSRKAGRELVNTGDPLVIEIWNLVFIEFNRKADGKLEALPARHVDTGMGFERLCMALQGKKSNYDTDIFQPIIQEIARLSGLTYGQDPKVDVAMRVMSDHLRAVTFAIADGQLPSNNKAGYVIRRILRRAVRYGYTFLGFREACLCKLVSVLVSQMGESFPEIKAQQELITKVIQEEEMAFLRTLETGIHKFEQYIQSHSGLPEIDGKFAFELFDTYGFPPDLTQLMAREQKLSVDMPGFDACMQAQKDRSRKAAEVDQEDWVEVHTGGEPVFTGYDQTEGEARILRYRKVKTKAREIFQLVLDKTPFYAESGGQVGDSGWLSSPGGDLVIEDTRKENNLWVHISSQLPADLTQTFTARVDKRRRSATAANHSATHLLHAALKEVLGSHVEQKGSLVDPQRLRFDFAHFSKMTPDEILRTEQIVNAKIRENIALQEHRQIAIEEARAMGAVALFGEKYGDTVRVITFDPAFSRELCGGTHVHSTGEIGMLKIVSEGAIAAGIRRIEAITGEAAEQLMQQQFQTLNTLKDLLKGSNDLVKNAEQLLRQNADYQKQIQEFQSERARALSESLIREATTAGTMNWLVRRLDLDSNAMKNLAFELRARDPKMVCIFGSLNDGKPSLTVSIAEALVAEKQLDAAKIVRELARDINGGGGGQKFFATAGGKEPGGLDKALENAKALLMTLAAS